MYSRPKHSSQSLYVESNHELASIGLPHTWGQAKCSDKSAGDVEALLLRGLTRFYPVRQDPPLQSLWAINAPA
jgi:hypothetical protein